MLQVLGVMDHPMPLGEVLVRCEGMRLSEVVAAVDLAETSSRVRRSGDLLERV